MLFVLEVFAEFMVRVVAEDAARGRPEGGASLPVELVPEVEGVITPRWRGGASLLEELAPEVDGAMAARWRGGGLTGVGGIIDGSLPLPFLFLNLSFKGEPSPLTLGRAVERPPGNTKPGD